ncbi:RNI-like protein [Coprinopsis marcescibilis]|uniref:RNI-like protein n=1 Tax=Coprinopsis marcescibilis TaxID=230819 RepID=A0A5C3L3Q5_COPMA|nr:RNI-like protein [Coprinopsis marcescibilis]
MSSQQYDIDNDDNLFVFDPYDVEAPKSYVSASMQPYGGANDDRNAASTPSHDAPFTSAEVDEQANSASKPLDKGKGVSMPMPIRPSTIVYDLFDVSPSSNPEILARASSSFAPSDFSSFGSPSSFVFSSPASSSSSYQLGFQTLAQLASASKSSRESTSPGSQTSEAVSGKGKSREMPPTLPPLTFCPTEIGEGQSAWLSFADAAPSPSFSSPTSPIFPPTPSSTVGSLNEAAGSSTVTSHSGTSVPYRCKSLSHLSADAEVVHKVKPLPIRAQSYLARKLAGSKRGTPTHSRPVSPASLNQGLIQPEFLQYDSASPSGRREWYVAPKGNESDSLVSRPPHPIPTFTLEGTITRPSSRSLLKHKGRSQSEPLPFSILDFVTATSTDIFEPLPLFIKTYFDDSIPREIHLHILRCFVQVFIDDHMRLVEMGRWSVNRASASRNQLVGKDRGTRELIKLSRVSKSWKSMVFDGQLWIDLDLHALPKLPHHVLLRISQQGGPFVQRLNLSGRNHMKPENLLDIASNLCLMAPHDSLSYTQLTFINLRGCVNLTTRSLHHLLIRSRKLQKLILKGLGAVTNTTCEILANYCTSLTSLNLSRCPNMDADGIRFMARAALDRQEHLSLKVLRLSGLKHVSDSTMQLLGRATPYLEVLDLSYARQLHNSALEAFVACDQKERTDEELGVETVVVNARDLGRDVEDSGRYRRRITRIRHLNLSSCLLLTDNACANLAYSLPWLEFLEMAGIGTDLKDAGLVRLLERTPLIRRLDLEDASDLSDAVLTAITPVRRQQQEGPGSPRTGSSVGEPEKQPGQCLQQLNLSYAVNLSDHAFRSLIRNCPNLVHLEADNTLIGASVLREFVNLSRERKVKDAKFVAVDCRGIGESVVKDLAQAGATRPRKGWRAYASRKLHYLDGRDGNEEDLKIGQDECDEMRVVVKTFYSWQTVDAVKAHREKRRKATSRRGLNASNGFDDDEHAGQSERGVGGGARWWTPGGRRSGSSSPQRLADLPNEGCRAM